MIQRNKNLAGLEAQGDTLANNPFSNYLNPQHKDLLRIVGRLGVNTDKLAPITGGSLTNAAKDLSEGLNDPKVLSNFKRISPASKDETNEAMQALIHNYYKAAPSEADGNAKTSSEKLIGGKADGKKDSLFDPKELKKGVKHEHEHTKEDSVAKEIAKDHLVENKHYYSRLAKAKIE
jgi:hypothetical protein